MSRISNNSLGLNSPPGPYTPIAELVNQNRFVDRDVFVKAASGTRAGTDLGRRGSIYVQTPGKPSLNNFTNMAEQVEKEMGNCIPVFQDQAPSYGPPGAPSIHPSYPVRARFENRKKWNDSFANPYVTTTTKDKRVGGMGGGGGDGSASEPIMMKGPPPPNISQVSRPPPTGPQPPKPQPMLLGCNIVSNGEDQYAHRMTYLNRWFDEDDGEIMITVPKSIQDKYIGSYSDELFKTPIDNTENKISTGIMSNPYTGEMFETFENAMPPPNKDKWIPAERFEIVNPKLLAMQGNLNHHAPLPKKKEICLDVPSSDFGPNVWGTQLYAEELRRRMVDVVNREVWMNRDGDYATPLAFAKEAPAGYIGVQQMYRALPYLPPVNELDDHGYMPVTDYQSPESTMVKAEVAVRKPDLTTCVYQAPVGPLHDNEAEYVVGQYTNRPTWRGGGDTYYAGVPYLPNNETGAPQQTENRNVSQKGLMQEMFQPSNVQNSTLDTGGNSYTVSQYENRNVSQKGLMQEQFQATGQENHVTDTGGGNYVVTQYENRNVGQKGLMQEQFQPLNAETAMLNTGSALYTVSQYENRNAGQKGLMQQSFSNSNVQNATLDTGGNLYTVNQYENRNVSQKGLMQEQFQPSNTQNATLDTGSALYTVNQYENRPTLKQLMQNPFDLSNFSDGGTNVTGGYIDFQGPILEVARSYYENLPNVGRPLEFTNGDYVGNGIITSRQNRGTDEMNYVDASKVPAEVGDTATRWIGQYDRDTKRQPVQNIPMSDLAPSFESVAPRMFGSLVPQCNLDLREVDDEFSWSHGFQIQTQDVITG
jgi:hypothetical protein